MKKLLGLLAVAPLSLAACGEKDPVVETVKAELEVTYNDSTKTLKVLNIELSDADDYEEYNKVGKAISDKVIEKSFYGDATIIFISGTIDGVEFTKEVIVSEIENDADSTSLFLNLSELMAHTFTSVTDHTNAGTIVKIVKESSTEKVEFSPSPEYIEQFEERFEEDFGRNGSYYMTNNTTYDELSSEASKNNGKLYAYNEVDMINVFSMIQTEIDVIMDIFEHSNFVFDSFELTDETSMGFFMFDMNYHYNQEQSKPLTMNWGNNLN